MGFCSRTIILRGNVEKREVKVSVVTYSFLGCPCYLHQVPDTYGLTITA